MTSAKSPLMPIEIQELRSMVESRRACRGFIVLIDADEQFRAFSYDPPRGLQRVLTGRLDDLEKTLAREDFFS